MPAGKILKCWIKMFFVFTVEVTCEAPLDGSRRIIMISIGESDEMISYEPFGCALNKN